MSRAFDSGLLNRDSSSMVAVYQISRYWRNLFLHATKAASDISPLWNEKEVAAAKIILSALMFLKLENCRNIEGLINQISKSEKLWE